MVWLLSAGQLGSNATAPLLLTSTSNGANWLFDSKARPAAYINGRPLQANAKIWQAVLDELMDEPIEKPSEYTNEH
jgi:hypothetical protein